MWPKNERQAGLLALAQSLAPKFAERAAEHDREGSFPFENFEELRRSGYTAASVPEEYGGGGYGLDDVALAHLALAKGDGSTAIGLAMHLMLCGGEGQARNWPEAARARIFDAVVRDGALINNAAAEPELGSPQGGGRPRTTVTPDGPGRWRLSGHKTFTTLAPALTYFDAYVAVEDGSGDTARVAVHRDLPGVRVEQTWDALGMRASGSDDVHFDGVAVSDDDFLSRSSPGSRREATQNAWFPILVGATSLGIAEAARDHAVRFARERQPLGDAVPIASIPHVREQIGRIDATVMAARALLLQAAEDWEQHPDKRAGMGPPVAAAKRLATNSAVEVVEIAMRIVGGVALYRSEPLERYFRDVRSGLVNPPIEARALETIARAALDDPE
ncbi:MAG: acyl-CoA dehydrogenase [Chloroflexi bacterium]|nr:acyl-CoA dehydrogenase [Chloroflexota bacterium]